MFGNSSLNGKLKIDNNSLIFKKIEINTGIFVILKNKHTLNGYINALLYCIIIHNMHNHSTGVFTFCYFL